MESVIDMIQTELECEDVLFCLYNLTETDVQIFEILIEQGEPVEIDWIAGIVERDRGTVFRSLKRLRKYGLVDRSQVNYESGGYYHIYTARDPKTITNKMQKDLNQLYTGVDQLIKQFRDKYGDDY